MPIKSSEPLNEKKVLVQEKRWRRAVRQMERVVPFWAYHAERLNLVMCRGWNNTAAVDGISLFWNPEFTASLNDKQLLFLLTHEVFHVAAGHLWRGQRYFKGLSGADLHREAATWNAACDYAIHQILVPLIDSGDYDELEFIKSGLFNVKYDRKSAESIFAELKAERAKKKKKQAELAKKQAERAKKADEGSGEPGENGPPGLGDPGEGDSKESASGKGKSKQKKSTSSKNVSLDAAPEAAASKDGAPEDDTAPEDTAPEDAAPEDDDDDAPGDDAPGDDAPGDDAPGDDAPGDDAPEDDAPGDDAPGDDDESEDDVLQRVLDVHIIRGEGEAPEGAQQGEDGSWVMITDQDGNSITPGEDDPKPEPLDPRGLRRQIKREIDDAKLEDRMLAQSNGPGRGKGGKGVVTKIDPATQSKMNWDLLKQFIVQSAHNDYSYAKPNRSYLSRGLIVPGMHSRALKIAVAIDTSSSIDKPLLNRFASEIEGVRSQLGDHEIEIIPCSSFIPTDDITKEKKTQIVRTSEDIDWNISIGGGTDFCPVFNYLEEQGDSPACLLYFTDLDGNFPQYEPGFPVMWAVPHDCTLTTPFGEIVKLTTV